MAKGKAANPADAYRKALRKKELKKNKAERAKNRDFALVKKDTRELEDEIEKLESNQESSASDKARLGSLKTELEKINNKKEEYVAEHPEHRKLVFKQRKQHDVANKEVEDPPELKSRNLFNKHGLPRHPERSIYYDPVMNPYGVAPPGMPYMERPLRPDEIDSGQEQEDDGSDDDIVMPEGRPPGEDTVEDSDDDNIPMPEGPPPKCDATSSPVTQPPLPPGPPPTSVPFPLPPNLLPPFLPVPRVFPGILGSGMAVPPPPGIPPPPLTMLPPPPSALFPLPPPPPGFIPPPGGQIPMPGSLPPPPPGFFPRRGHLNPSAQDPLSSIPHQTYQAHRAARTLPPPHPSLPVNPTSLQASSASGGASVSSAATVSAEPQLRDFKKESTAFVPTALKRKRHGGNATSSKVNSAPSIAPSADSTDETNSAAPRPDLLSTLRDQFGPPVNVGSEVPKPGKRKDDYEKFVEEMGDILGPPS